MVIRDEHLGPPSRLERSDVLVRQQKGNNEDAVCKEVQTWSALLSGAQRQGLECRADIVQALNPERAGNMAEARELPFIIGRLAIKNFLSYDFSQ